MQFHCGKDALVCGYRMIIDIICPDDFEASLRSTPIEASTLVCLTAIFRDSARSG
jgi:hypothetical protein